MLQMMFEDLIPQMITFSASLQYMILNNHDTVSTLVDYMFEQSCHYINEGKAQQPFTNQLFKHAYVLYECFLFDTMFCQFWYDILCMLRFHL